MDQSSSRPDKLPQLIGHPKGLFYLFFAEMWERFSFYGMRALLVLYMTDQLLFSDQNAYGVFAAYGSLVYVTPFIGGMIADRILGYRKAILLGGVLMAIGHFAMSFESAPFFYGALGLIIVGNGFFKPNISSFVGALYEHQPEKREAGFNIFYLGINLGGALSPLLCAWLGLTYGWHYGFALAGIGMLLGLMVFYQGLNDDVFGREGLAPLKPKSSKALWWSKVPVVNALAFLAAPVFALIIYYHHYEHFLVVAVTIGFAWVMGSILYQVSREERRRLLVVVYFTSLATIFFTIFEQAGSSLTLFAERNVDLILLNAAQTNSLNSSFIMLLAIPFSLLWPFLERRGRNPSSPIKFALGLVFLGLGFVVFAFGARSANAEAQVPMLYLAAGIFVYTVGEMLLSPVGLTKMTELAPVKYAGFIMGVWFIASFYGHFFAGQVAKLTAVDADTSWLDTSFFAPVIEGISGITIATLPQASAALQQLYQYVSIYTLFGCLSLVLGIIALLISPQIKKMMHGVK